VIVLAGDVGGTNARLALVDVSPTRATILDRQDFPSPKYPGLAEIVTEYLGKVGGQPTNACFGVPCPVVDGVCKLTNLSWTLELGSFRKQTGLKDALLINDFAAVGHAIPLLGPEDVIPIRVGKPEPKSAIAILGAGTGLGQGALVWDGVRYRVVASEGGHADFAPRTEEEMSLLRFLLTQFKRVSWERLVSGPGLVNIYHFLVASGYAPESAAVKAEMESGDPGAVITTRAMAGTDPICDHALDLFASIYGAQAGNLALIYRALGGVYLAGGITPRIASRLTRGEFMAAFGNKGRLSRMLEPVPVNIIVHSAPGILGAARLAADPALL
jgi:glucokinase